MGRFILIRGLQTIVALLALSMVVFLLARASGDPTFLMISSESTPQDIIHLRAQLGLDKSLPEQYGIFIKDVAHGDLGRSLVKKRPVTEMIGERLPNSLTLGISAAVLSILLAMLLGVIAATKRGTWIDSAVKALAITGQAMPSFWLALMAMIVFSVKLGWLPTSGMGGLANYVMPVSVMAFFLLPGLMRLVRSSMLDVLDTEYVKLARIKGLPERVVIWKHALRNALIAPLTVAGMLFANVITGAIIIETVYGWPGLGRLSYEAVLSRDYPVIQACVLLVATSVLTVNLLVDILYAYVDPQIRSQRT